MTRRHVLKVGSKGEIFLSEVIRDELNLNIGDDIIVNVHNNSLLIRKLHSLEEILSKPALVKISYQEFQEMDEEISKSLEE